MNDAAMVKVWDLFVRVFHWTLVATFIVAYVTAEDFEELHAWVGYLILALVVVRIVWGFIGSPHARFSSFVTTPAAAFAYARDAMGGRASRFLGHNPAGGLMIVLMLIGLIAITVSGIALYAVDEGEGPLAFLLAGAGESMEHLLEEVHEVLVNLMLGLIAVHIAGVVVESLVHRENLVRAMFTGDKRR